MNRGLGPCLGHIIASRNWDDGSFEITHKIEDSFLWFTVLHSRSRMLGFYWCHDGLSRKIEKVFFFHPTFHQNAKEMIQNCPENMGQMKPW